MNRVHPGTRVDCATDALLDGRETDQIYANHVLRMVLVRQGWL